MSVDLIDRCKKDLSGGQCEARAMQGSDYCQAHGSEVTLAHNNTRIYRLDKARYAQRLAELKDHNQLKSLREEIGLIRILMEERFNMIKTETDLLASCSTINHLALTLERLIKTTHQMEQNLGSLLNKQSIIILGQNIVTILVDELKGVENFEEIIDRTSDRLITTIEEAANIDKN